MSLTPRATGAALEGPAPGVDSLDRRLIADDSRAPDGGTDAGTQMTCAGSKKSSSTRSALHNPDSLLHRVFNIVCHVVYPVVTAPFLIGIFYMVAALRLASPSMGWCSRRFAFNPLSAKKQHWSSSTLFVLTGGLFRACPSATRNGDYAVIIFVVGLGLLFAISAPMFDIVVTDTDVVPGDNSLVAATIVGYIFAVYVFLWIGLKFSIYSRAEKARDRLMQRDRASHPKHKSATLKAQREAVLFLADIDDLSVSFTPLWTLAIGIGTSIIECTLVKIYSGHFEGAAARFRNLNNEWSALTYATFFFILTSTNTIAWFGFYLLYEQAHHLTVFCDKAKLNITSTNDSQVARWAVAWQYLLQEMERAPMVCSIAPACSVLLFLEAAASLMFGVLNNLYTSKPLQDLVPIFVFVGSHSIFLLFCYLWVIVRTQNVIERQHKAISALQNSMQLQVDAAALENDDQVLPGLRAKVRVLQSLDRYLLIADPKPKILGTSVDSFRWAIINFSLLTINVTFLLLYLVFCYKRQTRGSPTLAPISGSTSTESAPTTMASTSTTTI